MNVNIFEKMELSLRRQSTKGPETHWMLEFSETGGRKEPSN